MKRHVDCLWACLTRTGDSIFSYIWKINYHTCTEMAPLTYTSLCRYGNTYRIGRDALTGTCNCHTLHFCSPMRSSFRDKTVFNYLGLYCSYILYTGDFWWGYKKLLVRKIWQISYIQCICQTHFGVSVNIGDENFGK